SLSDEGALEGTGYEVSFLAGLIADLDEAAAADGAPDKYTAKIESPVYEIRGDCPEVEDLLDLTKAHELLAAIDQADLPPEVAAFLRAAAMRHARFNYGKIAEFYAHADAPTQALFEASALVIIDFDAAIEHGFVRMTKLLLDATGREEL